MSEIPQPLLSAIKRLEDFAFLANTMFNPIIREIGKIIMPDTLEAVLLGYLKEFLQKEPVAFYDLVRICKDKNHKMLGSSQRKIESHGFGEIKSGVLNISDAVVLVIRKYVRGRNAALWIVEPEVEE